MLGSHLPKSPQKVIILDFDVPVTNRLTALFTGSAFELNPLIIGILDNICKASGAKLVCSSNRATIDQKDKTTALLIKAGFDCDAHLHTDWSCNYRSTVLDNPDKSVSAAIRMNNIQRWLAEHPEVTIYAVLDDLELDIKNFVHITNINNGISFEDLQKTCYLLGIELNAVTKAANPKAPRIKFPDYEP